MTPTSDSEVLRFRSGLSSLICDSSDMGREVALWLRHYAPNRKVAGSNPDVVNEFFFFNLPNPSGFTDRLCGLVVRVPGYTTEMYCVSCEVRTEFIYVA
jgi:hypothetical protein